ncbi:ligand-binding sensor domain-containing protein [Tenacibaculum sp. ZS6-P6]|uniref:ligand-binding sensor domain-containing protein n=1 Tax=Tenacibaculum sp. ZS6-P6 TaxID=3447503 RepID=UPI003F99081E
MLRFIYTCLILIFTISCKTEKHKVTTKNNEIISDINTEKYISFISKIDTVFNSNAPKRITRNIKLDHEGNLLIAAYDDIIRYNGKSFTRLKKPKKLESWYAFDVLEDRKKNIWIASDQLGAFRIDSKTGTVTNFTTKNGLGHLRNMCIYEDKAGNIWIGGQGGLSKYDGSRFVNFTTEDGLPHNDINTILEDTKGNIWFGTRGNAGFYDGNTFSEIINNEGKPFFNVWSIIEDNSKNIWLVDSSGLWKYNNNSFNYELSDVWKIYEDIKGHFWFTGMPEKGASSLKKTEINSITGQKLKLIDIFKSEKMLFGIVDDKKGNLYIGGGNGIWLYDGKTIKYYTGIKINKSTR